MIFREHDTADSMYLVQSGIVQMRKRTEEGDEHDLGKALEGDVFGELALLDSHPRTSNAITVTPCELFILDQISFMSLLLTSRSQVVYRVFSALISRIRETHDRYMRTELERQRLEDSMKIEQLRTLETELRAGTMNIDVLLYAVDELTDGLTVEQIKEMVAAMNNEYIEPVEDDRWRD